MGVELARDKTGYHDMEDANFSDLELVRHFRDILTTFSSGDSGEYHQLVGLLHHKRGLAPDEVALLVTSLKGLSGAVSCIDITCHESLLSTIFAMSLWNHRPDVMDALLELVISLAATNGQYLDSCLQMLVRNFKPPFSFIELLKHPRGLARKEEVLSRVHSAFKDIADLVPLAPLRLEDIVVQNMPSKYSKEDEVMTYVENMFRLESGAIGELIGSRMLMAVVDSLIELDVEIGWDDILQVQDDSSKGIFQMELEDMDEMADDEFPGESLSQRSLGGNVIAEKLDRLLVRTFEHLESCQAGGRLIGVFETLLQSFECTILNTYKSKFAQFVMFYACALDPENCGVRFAVMLADMFVSNVHPHVSRMSAVAYLASYLSRAKFLSTSFITDMLKRLVDWCLEYREVQDCEIYPKVHRLFYSGCQAIMYVLCFRMSSIMNVPQLRSKLQQMPIEQILKHKLDPLKVCLPSVVQEFLRQAKAAHLFTISEKFVFNDVLESELSKAFGGLERLDMFFPFDPCLLKNSDRYIRQSFVYWSLVRTTCDGGDEDDDDKEEEDDFEVNSDEDIEDLVTGNTRSFMDDGVPRSFNEQDLDYAMDKMSISPMKPINHRFGGRLQEPARMPSRLRPSMSPESL